MKVHFFDKSGDYERTEEIPQDRIGDHLSVPYLSQSDEVIVLLVPKLHLGTQFWPNLRLGELIEQGF